MIEQKYIQTAILRSIEATKVERTTRRMSLGSSCSLEGRVDGDKYALILRLTNMELKSIE